MKEVIDDLTFVTCARGVPEGWGSIISSKSDDQIDSNILVKQSDFSDQVAQKIQTKSPKRQKESKYLESV